MNILINVDENIVPNFEPVYAMMDTDFCGNECCIERLNIWDLFCVY